MYKKYTSPLVSCIECKKLTSSSGIFSHFLHLHSSDSDRLKMQRGQSLGAKKGCIKSSELNSARKENVIKEYSKNPNHCKNCQLLLPFNKRSNIFCNNSCSASYNNNHRNSTIYDKARFSLLTTLGKNPNTPKKEKTNKIKRSYFKADGPYSKIYGNLCSCCSKWFWSKTDRKTCSPECQRKNSTYRKIVIEYEHNGEVLKLESTWELEIAKWLDEKHIEWIRPAHIPWKDSKGKLRRYFPDFFLPKYNLYLDPKNSYQIKISQEKLKLITENYQLLYGKVEYIKQKIEEHIA